MVSGIRQVKSQTISCCSGMKQRDQETISWRAIEYISGPYHMDSYFTFNGDRRRRNATTNVRQFGVIKYAFISTLGDFASFASRSILQWAGSFTLYCNFTNCIYIL